MQAVVVLPLLLAALVARWKGFRHALVFVALPTLLVRGKMSDLLSEEGARTFLEQVPHARFADVSGAGHMVAGDKNDAFSDAVLAFLAKTLRS